MMVIVPESTLFAGVRRQLLWITMLTLLVAALVVAWTVRLSRAFSEPIQKLVVEGERLSRGDLESAEEIHTSLSEIRRLDSALQNMRDSLGTLLQVERSAQLAHYVLLTLARDGRLENESQLTDVLSPLAGHTTLFVRRAGNGVDGANTF